MRKLFLLLMVCCFISCKQHNENTSKSETFIVLQQLYDDQDYFGFSHYLKSHQGDLSDLDKLYFNALDNNVFNKAKASNTYIESLLKYKEQSLHDSLLTKLYQIKLLNHVNLYEYKDAAITSELLTRNFLKYLDSLELENLRNEYKIWNSLRTIPKQEIIRNKNVEIP